MNDNKKRLRSKITLSIIMTLVLITVFGIVGIPGIFAQETTTTHTEPAAPAAAVSNNNLNLPFGLLAAAIAFGISALGAGIAVASVGAAAMGAIGEKPEIAGQAIIFVALGEGIVIFGFITALMILGKV